MEDNGHERTSDLEEKNDWYHNECTMEVAVASMHVIPCFLFYQWPLQTKEVQLSSSDTD